MYFPNGTSGLMFQEENCFHCLNFRDLEDGRGAGCPIWDVHTLFNYDQIDNAKLRELLGVLIPEEGATCTMLMDDKKDHETLNLFET